MALIRSLTVMLKANTDAFNKNMKKSSMFSKSFGKNLKGLAKIAAGAFAAQKIVSFTKSVVQAFVEFEHQMARVSTMVRDNVGPAMDRLSSTARQVAKEFGLATSDIANSMFDVLSASIKQKDVPRFLEAAAKAAVGGVTDISTATSALIAITNAYGKSASDVMDVSDQLFAVVARGVTTFDAMGRNIGKIAPLASAAGIEFKEIGGALALLTRSGLSTELAVTRLASVIGSILKPSKEAADLAESLGIELSAAALKAEGLEGVLKSIAKLDLDTIAKMFPKESVATLVTILSKMNELEGDIIAVGDAAGETEKAFGRMTDTQLQKINRLKAGWADFKIDLGTGLVDTLDAIDRGVDSFVDSVLFSPSQQAMLDAQQAALNKTLQAQAAVLRARRESEADTAFSTGIPRLEAQIESYRRLVEEGETSTENLKSAFESFTSGFNHLLATRNEPEFFKKFPEHLAAMQALKAESDRLQDSLEGRLFGKEFFRGGEGLKKFFSDSTKPLVDLANSDEIKGITTSFVDAVNMGLAFSTEKTKKALGEIGDILRPATERQGQFGIIQSTRLNIRGLTDTAKIQEKQLTVLQKIERKIGPSIPALA